MLFEKTSDIRIKIGIMNGNENIKNSRGCYEDA